jgi:hypothetical protein
MSVSQCETYGVRFLAGTRDSSLLYDAQTWATWATCGAEKPPIQGVMGGSFPGIKAAGM